MPSSLKTKSKAGPRSPAPQWRLRASADLQVLELLPFRQIDGLVHGFSTRPGGASALGPSPGKKVLNLGDTEWDRRERVQENRRRFTAALGPAQMPLVTLRQMHSDVAHVVCGPLPLAPQGDALLTSARGLLLAVQTADCIPILLVDRRHRAVAAIHAGWRGTLRRIASKTLGRMQMEFSTRPCDVVAAIGPGISPCCYQVGPEVVKEFAAQFPRARSWFDGPFDVLASGEDPNPLPWLSGMPPGHEPPPLRCSLDLKAANASLLEEAGVPPQNIFLSDLCTSCSSDLFFSYRREKSTGRMMSVIGMA